MKKFIFPVLALLIAVMSCSQPQDVIVNATADDGFALVESSVGFNTETSVSRLDATASMSGSFNAADFWAPAQFDALENGSDPVITFTFNESLRADAMEAVFSISYLSGGTIYYEAETGNPVDNVFYDMGGFNNISATNVTVSGATVSFTFDADTFAVGDNIIAVFGVASASGEVYQVTTAFQPVADVITAPVVTSLLDEMYYAYAVDTTKIYYLQGATPGTHVVDPTAPQVIQSVTSTAGSIGHLINNVSKRYNFSGTLGTNVDYAHLQDVEDTDGQISNTYYFTHTLSTNASYYDYYIEDAEGNQNNIVGGYSTTTLYAEDGVTIIGYGISFNMLSNPIESGDTIVVVPANIRGDYPALSGTLLLTDTVRPYNNSGLAITTTEGTSITWAGQDWSTHGTDLADDEGEIVEFASFNLTSLTGWGNNEAIELALESLSLNAADTNTVTPLGQQRAVTSAQVLESDAFAASGCSADVTLVSTNSGYLSVALDGTTLYVFGGFECNDGTDGINYSARTWEVTGSINLTITDMSGNPFLYVDSVDGDVNDGTMTVSFN